MCELVLHLRASWRTLSELYMLRKLEYHCTIPGGPYARPLGTERPYEIGWPFATVLPKATGISWLFASWVKYILSRRGLMGPIAGSFPLTFIVRGDAYPIARANCTCGSLVVKRTCRGSFAVHSPSATSLGPFFLLLAC